ncbi:ATP-dependent helicase BRM-like protein [Tanacetum coccineum]
MINLNILITILLVSASIVQTRSLSHEAQRMKDRESILARDLDKYRCQRRLLLTGTPLQHPVGLYFFAGKMRARDVALNAVQSPLLDIGIERATGIFWNITGGAEAFAQIRQPGEGVEVCASNNRGVGRSYIPTKRLKYMWVGGVAWLVGRSNADCGVRVWVGRWGVGDVVGWWGGGCGVGVRGTTDVVGGWGLKSVMMVLCGRYGVVGVGDV